MKKRKLIITNLIVSVLFLLPVKQLNLFNENYSTLSLTAKGYFYLLFLGIIIGLLFAYETCRISNNFYGVVTFASMLIGVMIPHHVPYNLQGNLHLVCAYIGFVGLVICTIINCKIKKYRDIYFLFIFAAVLLYLRFGMVTTISEIIVMLASLFINCFLYNRYGKK